MTEAVNEWVESAFIPYQSHVHPPRGTALILAPHPDDEVFGCAGAILRHLEAGDTVHVVIATDSSYGWFGVGEEGPSVRRQESRAAGRFLGYGEPIFWGYDDRKLVYDERLINSVLDVIAATQADVLYAPSWWEIHPDHYVMSLAAMEALRRSSSSIQLMMYEIGVPLHPNFLLDISEVMKQKQEAMACFESQLKIQGYDAHITALNRFRSYTLPAQVEYAEAFRFLERNDLFINPLQAIRPGLFYAQSVRSSVLAQPLVSILYLGGVATLADALDSVQLQTYPHIELIVSGVGFLDPSEGNGNLSHWREGRFPPRLLRLDGIESLAERANRAMERALGDWLVLLGEGDSLEPDHIAKMMARAAGSGTTTSYCAGVRKGEALELYREEEAWRLPPEPRLPFAYATMPLCAGFFPNSLIKEGCRFNTELDDDLAIWEFWVQLACKSTWVVSSELTTRHQERIQMGSMNNAIALKGEGSLSHVIEGWLSHCSSRVVSEALSEAIQEWDRANKENKALIQKIADLESNPNTAQTAGISLQKEGVVGNGEPVALQQEGIGCNSGVQQFPEQKTSLKCSTFWILKHRIKKALMALIHSGK